MNEQELLRRIKNGDHEAFSQLLEKYKKPLFSFIFNMTRDESASEDIFQELFLNFYKRIFKYKEKNRFGSWIFTSARNLTLDYLRKRSKEINRSQYLDDENDSTGKKIKSDDATPDENALKSEENSKLENAMSKIPEEQREVMVLRINSGLSFKEISKITNSPLGTVLTRMSRGIEKLRAELG
jgi:RNA polymerase sigma-70 factor, ECF subfamily